MNFIDSLIRDIQKSKNTCIRDTSVILVNNNTKKITFYNGVTGKMEPLTENIFNELLKREIIEMEKCACQGDTRFIRKGEQPCITW